MTAEFPGPSPDVTPSPDFTAELLESKHVDLDAIADAQEDLPDPEQAALVRAHLTQCAECAAIAAVLTETCAALADEPAPAMPDAVFERLTAVVAAESARRRSGRLSAEEQAARTQAAKRTAIGSFGENPSYGKKSMRPFQRRPSEH